MKRLLFDIETNGFLDTLTKVHCISFKEVGSDTVYAFGGPTDYDIRDKAIPLMMEADELIGHNALSFDIPALKKAYPSFAPKAKIIDTLNLSQLIWTNLKEDDFKFRRKNPDYPGELIGRHKLKAWGYRLGVLKGKMEGNDWYETWTPELQEYCKQDVRVLSEFYDLILSKNYSQQAIDLELEFQQYMTDQERDGLPFDEEAAKALYAELAAERATLESQIAVYFPSWEKVTNFIPKVNNKTRGYVKGQLFLKRETVAFNPRSHKHVAERLKLQRAWEPEEYTETGEPSTDADVMEVLGKKWPECALLAKHAEIQKIIGMVAEGKSAYLKKAVNGRIHGRVITNGTVTGRCAHKEPNLGNIPRRSALGKRVRALFVAPPGFRFVGCDAKGLEIRMLSHFLVPFDGGAYAKIAVEGDPHLHHQALAALDTKDDAKAFFYGWLYGAGDSKIGLIIGKGQAAGRKLRLLFLSRFPALGKLKNKVTAVAEARGWLKGLDGRTLHIRAAYSSLNTLLQSAGAVLVKQWTVLFNRELRARGLYQSGTARMVVHVHDEFQNLVKIGHEEEVAAIAKATIIQAGELLGLRVKTEGDAKHGSSWAETH